MAQGDLKKEAPEPEEKPKKSSGGTEAPPKTQAAPYTLGEWKGFPRFQCSKCPFDSLDEEVIKQHVKTHEPPPPRLWTPGKEV